MYELLAKWAAECKNKNLSCEIGVREGLGSKIILDNMKPNKHIGIDPYGNLNYQHYDHTDKYQCDYTEGMRVQLLKDMSVYENFDLFHMTDIDFMDRFYDAGAFDFVHFDGPHMTRDVLREAIWFGDRSTSGTRFVFDDYTKYNQRLINEVLTYFGFVVQEEGTNKIMLEKS